MSFTGSGSKKSGCLATMMGWTIPIKVGVAGTSKTIGSMYRTHILDEHQLNVGKYTIHWFCMRDDLLCCTWFFWIWLFYTRHALDSDQKNNDNQKYQSTANQGLFCSVCVFVKHFFLMTLFSVFFLCCRRHSHDAPPRSWSNLGS